MDMVINYQRQKFMFLRKKTTLLEFISDYVSSNELIHSCYKGVLVGRGTSKGTSIIYFTPDKETADGQGEG